MELIKPLNFKIQSLISQLQKPVLLTENISSTACDKIIPYIHPCKQTVMSDNLHASICAALRN